MEKIIQCKACGKDIAISANKCPHCGHKNKAGKNVKTCKTCGEIVAKSANKCPHCGAKQNQGVYALCWVIVIITLFSCCSIIGSAGDAEPTVVGSSSSNQEAKPTEPSSFSIGEKVELNDIVVTMTSVKESNGSQFNKPQDGYTFLICEFEIENNSNSDIAVSSLMSFEAYINGYSTNMDLGAVIASETSQLDGTVAAGKKMHGVIGYSAPTDWEDIEIRFTPNFWAGKDIIFTYTK